MNEDCKGKRETIPMVVFVDAEKLQRLFGTVFYRVVGSIGSHIYEHTVIDHIESN